MKDRGELSREIAIHLMKNGGWGEIDPHSIEFDFNRDDSQASILSETVMEVLDYLMDSYNLSEDFYEDTDSKIFDEDADYFMTLGEVPTAPGVHTTTAFSVYLAHNSTFSDLMQFVSQLQLLQVEKDTQLYGSLMYGHTVKQPVLDRMHCISCDLKDYIVILNGHECELGEPEKNLE